MGRLLARFRGRRGAIATVALIFALAIPATVAAHPLGNFTINHFAGIRIEPEVIRLDVVLDRAEIPTFEARLDLDADDDGEVSDEETAAARVEGCAELMGTLALAVDGAPLTLRSTHAGLSFPPGVGGLSTMRQVCGYEATPAELIAGGEVVSFASDAFSERAGWREMVVQASGLSVTAMTGELRSSTLSDRLTAYPEDLIARPLDDRTIEVTVAAGGPVLPPFTIPDAEPLAGVDPGPQSPASPAPGPAVGAVPGGIVGDLPAIFRTSDLTPFVLLLSLVTAAALGAGHALTPGHGKTLMAAYLVGTRGTPLHALGLGLSVTLSHTVGILALAAIIVGAEGLLPPDTVVRAAPVVAAISIVLIGGWMLTGELRRRRADRRATHHEHPHPHPHAHDAHGNDDHGHAHSHAPPAGSTVTWRSLFVLGLAGGLIPSTSALLILLGALAAGRPAFGLVLVVAFGLGMALVMGGIGVALVLARERLERLDGASQFSRLTAAIPLAAAVLVFGFGLYLTVQAIAAPPTL